MWIFNEGIMDVAQKILNMRWLLLKHKKWGAI